MSNSEHHSNWYTEIIGSRPILTDGRDMRVTTSISGSIRISPSDPVR